MTLTVTSQFCFIIRYDSSDTIPTLKELQTLQRNNKQIKIIESIASEWENVAIALSVKMGRIRIEECWSGGWIQREIRQHGVG